MCCTKSPIRVPTSFRLISQGVGATSAEMVGVTVVVGSCHRSVRMSLTDTAVRRDTQLMLRSLRPHIAFITEGPYDRWATSV